eukprot:TRINITY_DN17342_c0_g1_i1.p4 TRINITY_DN17342_c0_g1~~TRINITY_DN17342_c0_g1_i1.p4  ORF type:complete len:103 (+),score=28.87 TRINITY_DN17342_c0_g1_i1:725-1033(+)
MQVAGYVLLSLTLVSQLMLVVFLVDLLLLHKWLREHGLTTFEYVLYLKEKQTHPSLQLKSSDIKQSHQSKVIRKIKDVKVEGKIRLDNKESASDGSFCNCKG